MRRSRCSQRPPSCWRSTGWRRQRLAHLNLCSAYVALASVADDAKHDPGANLDAAITAAIEGQPGFPRDQFPRRWASMRHMRGLAYLQRRGRGRNGSGRDDEHGFTALLEGDGSFTAIAFPHDALVTGRVLSGEAAERGRWDLAVAGCTRAVEAAEQLRRQAELEARRDEILVSASGMYAGLVESLLKAGRTAEAFAAGERGKARGIERAAGRTEPSPFSRRCPWSWWRSLDEPGRRRSPR